ncbi:MAG: hypothetical protein KAR19_19065 [Bacteroidales bacterium]|nr:hypothetical protein [Bacteroidales bacterium]
MDTTFIFGQIASGEYFTGREWFTERLVSKLTSHKNIILISPRGWGKSSLVNRVGSIITDQNYNYRTCYIDLQSVHSEEAFLETFMCELSAINAPILPTRYTQKQQRDDILNLPEYTAIRDRIKLIVFIGNIQKIARFKNSLQFQQKLRLVWRQHNHCTYCLYGINQLVTRYLLDTPRKPFQTMGQIFNMPRIQFNELIIFIQNRFEITGKQISEKVAAVITLKANCLPYYVQLLAWHSWIRTKSTCNHQIVEEAIEHLTLQFSLQYQTLTDSLTTKQLSYLKALLSIGEKICSRDNLQKYNLGTSANVARLRNSLKNKEIIETVLKETILLDPFYSYWLQEYYFRFNYQN